MKETTQQLLSESAKYGLAILVLVATIIGLSFAVSVLWKHQNKREKENADVIKENTIAFKDLQATLRETTNLIILKLK